MSLNKFFARCTRVFTAGTVRFSDTAPGTLPASSSTGTIGSFRKPALHSFDPNVLMSQTGHHVAPVSSVQFQPSSFDPASLADSTSSFIYPSPTNNGALSSSAVSAPRSVVQSDGLFLVGRGRRLFLNFSRSTREGTWPTQQLCRR